MNREIENLKEKCTGCWACANVCAHGAITMTPSESGGGGFLYPVVDKNLCVNCTLCDKVCPIINPKPPLSEVKEAYFGTHRNDDIRLSSSSGGVFSAIAETILAAGGVVFGAEYNLKEQSVRHNSTQRTSLAALRKSKYVQSEIRETFREAKKLLEQQVEVLFVGTACQIAGLKSFLRRDYPTLTTCDFICHGVPPIKMLNDHISGLEKRQKARVVKVDFRPKVQGWSTQMLECVFENGSKYRSRADIDPYFNAFFQNISLRESCYRCIYSKGDRYADITLADFWGYRKVDAAINDEKGLSIFIANTKRGKETISRINTLNITSLPEEKAAYLYASRSENRYSLQKRTDFFEYYTRYGWNKTTSRFRLNGSFWTRIKIAVKKILRR